MSCARSVSALRLVRGRLAALAAGGFLLRGRSALRRVAARGAGGAGRLAAAAGRAGGVGDLRCALLRHALVLQRLVLLLVLDVAALSGHELKMPIVRGNHTQLRAAAAADVDRLVAWHDDPDVARYWDDEHFTADEMRERLARADVDAWIVEADGEPIGYLQ